MIKDNPIIFINESQIGDVVTFGSMEQDGNLSNGSEDIEWIVLDKKNSNTLLISKEIIAHYRSNTYMFDQCYGKYDDYQMALVEGDYAWSKSPAREYLNTTLISCLPNEYIQNITSSIVRNQELDTIEDKIFILNQNEIEQYMPYSYERKASITRNVEIQMNDSFHKYWSSRWWGIHEDKNEFQKGKNQYWIRSDSNNSQIYVNEKGEIKESKAFNGEYFVGLRPCIWIGLN